MVLAARPGHRATVLVALAVTAGTRVKSRAGNDTKLPPPATAFNVPAIAAAKNRRMAWLRCKPTVYQKSVATEKRLDAPPKLKSEGLVAVFDWKSGDRGGARRSVGAARGQGRT